MTADASASTSTRPVPPPGIGLRSLDPAAPAERDSWLALSNAAFEGHPENGGWTRADADGRFDAAWTDSRRFPVLVDSHGLVAGVWTKREPGAAAGELYVVSRRAQGLGCGRIVVDQALRDLRGVGCRTAELYVDAQNDRARRLYRSAGFAAGMEHHCLHAVLASTAPAVAEGREALPRS